jgi:ketosteroid isomerase-like protein
MIARRLLRAIESRETTAIWSMFADRPLIEFPFLGLSITDFATFDAAVGPLLANLDRLVFSEPDFEPLADPRVLFATYTGRATVVSTGRPYVQTYVTRIRVDGTKVRSYAEYFDTAVLAAALEPADTTGWASGEVVGRERP